MQKKLQYFKVTVEMNSSLKGTFNLTLHRLMKKREAKANGFAPRDQWVLAGSMKGVEERSAMCLKKLVETPLPPLKNYEEVTAWLKVVAKLEAK